MTNGKSLVVGKNPITGKWAMWAGDLLKATIRPRLNHKGVWLKCEAGLRIDIVWGPIVRPIAKFYHWKFWAGNKTFNPWNGGNYWFVLNVPFAIMPFISGMFGKMRRGNVPGFYIGGRTANLSNRIDWQLRKDWGKKDTDKEAWAWNEDGSPKEAWPIGKYKNKRTIEPSIAIRNDFTH